MNKKAEQDSEQGGSEQIKKGLTTKLVVEPGVNSTNAKDFTQGAVHKHLIRLTGFMMMGLVTLMGANLVEAIYISRVGTNELAALSFTFPLIMLFQGLAMGLAIGASSVVARTIGAGDYEKARILITHCLLLVVLLILAACMLTYNNVDFFFKLLGADDSVLPLAVDFMQIWLFGLPFFTIAMVGSTLMRASGDAVTPGYLMAIGSALHVLISPIFIFGFLGAPELGLEGAAIGFVIARTVSFLMYSYVLMFRNKLLVFKLQGFFQSCRDILHVGLPAMASNFIHPISMSIITKLLAGHGAVVVAGFGVASRIESVVVIVIIAQSMSVAPFIGQNWGAALFDRVKLGLSFANRLAMVWGLVAYVCLFFTSEFIVSMINDDAGVVKVAVRYLLIMPLSIGFMGILMNAGTTFNALGKPMPALSLTILHMVVVLIPLAILGNYLWAYTGIFIASAVTVASLSLLAWYWITREIETGIERRQTSLRS